MLHTTLNKIRRHSPCLSGWVKLLTHLGKTSADDEPLPFSVILKSNGLDDALRCCRAAPEYNREWRLFAVWCATQVKHLMTDERSLNALVVAENFANGLATQEELDAASDAALAVVVSAARVEGPAARVAAAAARVASDAVLAAASDAANAAAWGTSGTAARYAQSEVFSWIVSGEFAKWERG